jgi:hypothetical protein
MPTYRHCVAKYRKGSKKGKCKRYAPGAGLGQARKTKRTTKGWAKRAPSRVSARRELKKRCGAKAFLLPGELKYPIMAKSGPCTIDCQGLRAAKSRLGAMATSAKRVKRYAESKKFRRLQMKADRIGRKAGCRWAR